MLTIPPKTSHRLQPLEVSVFGPFKRNYNKAINNWMRTYPGKTLTIYEVLALVKEAQICALVQRNILSGLKSLKVGPTIQTFLPKILQLPQLLIVQLQISRPLQLMIYQLILRGLQLAHRSLAYSNSHIMQLALR